MKKEIIMPKMGESIVEGTIIKWIKNEGDIVKKDENILLISTDKVEAEIASPIDGILREIKCLAGATEPVGAILGYVTSEKEDIIIQNNDNIITETNNISKKLEPNIFISPLVKRIMNNNNISLDAIKTIEGSGINNRITKKDIMTYIQNNKEKKQNINNITKPIITDNNQTNIEKKIIQNDVNNALPEDNILEISNMRKIIMKNMLFSKTNSAHVATFFDIDYTNIDKYRKINKKILLKNENINLTYTSFIVHAACKALKNHPYINAEINNNNIILKKNINLGIAVAIRDPEPGLMVPVIKNADKLNINGIAEKIQDLSKRSATKKIKPDELSGGSFTITNPGNFGAITATPIINQPQVAILGIGGIRKEVKVIQVDNIDTIAIRNIGWLCLTFDHRIIDGIVADSFMQELKNILENWKN